MQLLAEVTRSWGNTTVIESYPGSETRLNAIYVPFRSSIFFDSDPNWGIYDRDGRLVQAAAYYRGPTPTLIGQSESCTLRPAELEVVDEELVYGGPFIMHYGHFVTASLPRLWHIVSNVGKKRRILCHSHEEPEVWFSKEFIRAMLSAIGLAVDDFVRLEAAATIRRLWVPRPAMEEQNFIHRVFEDLGTAIGRAYGVHHQYRNDTDIYLSKTRLGEGITHIEQEQVLEDCLAARGIQIVHPQELSFPDQVQLLARARTITGTVGSGLHTTLFLDRPSRIVALTGGDAINSNQTLIDRLKGNDSLYLCPRLPAGDKSYENGFQSTRTIESLANVAQEFAAYV